MAVIFGRQSWDKEGILGGEYGAGTGIEVGQRGAVPVLWFCVKHVTRTGRDGGPEAETMAGAWNGEMLNASE